MSRKTESTTSLISKDSEDPSLTSMKSDSANIPAKTSSSSTSTPTTTANVPTSFSDFAQKSKDNGWATPTPTRPSLG
ncbi:hypothetical protein L218DRAFT_957370 [Marasmius fiardii PR-910]|nr:hypothetical protein L218DRAFT_957370 [Marasmius fiardii PR-910]